MRSCTVLTVAGLAMLQLAGCVSLSKRDLGYDPFPTAQAEIRKVLDGIFHDAKIGNVESLRASHLDSAKFTKFGGEMFERMNIDQCNESEAAKVRAATDIELETRDVKIDVFGDVAVLTNYIHVSYQMDDQPVQAVARGTLVFLKTNDGWKIVHEHITPKKCFEP